MNPFYQPAQPALAIGYGVDTSGTVSAAGNEYTEVSSASGQRSVGGGNVVALRAGRQLVKIGNGGMYAPRKSE